MDYVKRAAGDNNKRDSSNPSLF